MTFAVLRATVLIHDLITVAVLMVRRDLSGDTEDTAATAVSLAVDT